MRRIERYLNVRSAHGASVAPDGTLAFLYNATGTPQVWTLDEPGAWPTQRTFYDESVSFCQYAPEDGALAFGMDEGGNERAQLYRLDPDGSVTNWTQHPEAKHRWGGWSSDGSRFAFASNRRDNAVFDVYVQERDATGTEADLVYEGDGWLSLAGWSPDDDALLVHEAHSSFDHDAYTLDLDSGELTHLTPHEGNVRYGSLQWGPDGDIYLVTDEDRDTLALARLTTDGDLDVVRADDEWNVDGVAMDEDTGRLVYSRNVDGYTDLTAADLGDDGLTLTERDLPDLPDGVAGGVSFFDGAERFAVTATSDADNANVHTLAVGGDRERWTDAATAGLPREGFRTSELVRFETFDGREIPAYYTEPADAPEEGAPVIVDIHGGPESQRRPSFSAVKQYFLDRGYGYFEPNVRGSTGYGKAYTHLDDVEKRMDSVRDIRAGVEWLSARGAVDSDRLVVMGGSYGGFMCLACLTEYPDLWAAGVDIVGIASFVTFLENTGDWRRALREAEYGSLAEDREFLESISPLNRADRIRAPLFVMHGANDPRVPVGEAEQIAEEAAEHVPVEKLIFDDEGHGIAKRENRVEAYSAVADFLDEHV
ncbi:alpha/beta hydrolase family protein [Halosegnis marinus]|uniref:Prolyl oligopeptidase family serine peptidase n=1 Tax=Halosegnis marinus TaxID=3034023 RepID=A0ABD5ZQ01_9EURY|nr:S9 family peptidase [Halosegnis sp. DT85]